MCHVGTDWINDEEPLFLVQIASTYRRIHCAVLKNSMVTLPEYFLPKRDEVEKKNVFKVKTNHSVYCTERGPAGKSNSNCAHNGSEL